MSELPNNAQCLSFLFSIHPTMNRLSTLFLLLLFWTVTASAQDVQLQFPELVMENTVRDSKETYLALNYAGISVVAI